MANLDHRDFKYDLFRQPGDLHVHMFGTVTLSCAAGVTCQTGDILEISAPDFGPALRNPLRLSSDMRTHFLSEKRRSVAAL